MDANLDDIIKVTFHIMQDGKPVAKEVAMNRSVFIEYNQRKPPKAKWAELYQMIVDDKAYISITDLGNSN